VSSFLLNAGVEFVLTERFCQDTLEEYFGCQRQSGRRNENLDISLLGYNANALRIQKSVSCSNGNTKGRKDKCQAWQNISDEPLPKIKRKIASFIFDSF